MKKFLTMTLCVCALALQGACIAQEVGTTGYLPLAQIRDIREVSRLVFTDDGKYLVASNKNTIALFNTTTGKAEQSIPTGLNRILSFAVSPDGQFIACGGSEADGKAYVWNAVTGEKLQEVSTLGPVSAVAFAPDNKTFAIASGDTASLSDLNGEHEVDLTVWAINDKAPIHQIKSLTLPIAAMVFSADGTQLKTVGSGFGEVGQVLGTNNNGAFSWSYGTKGRYTTISVKDGQITKEETFKDGSPNCAFSRDGSMLAVLGANARYTTPEIAKRSGRQAIEWSGNPLRTYKLPTGDDDSLQLLSQVELKQSVNDGTASLAWHPEGKCIAAAVSFTVWLHAKGIGRRQSDIAPLDILDGNIESFTCVAFSPSGNYIAAGCRNGIQIWATSQR